MPDTTSSVRISNQTPKQILFNEPVSVPVSNHVAKGSFLFPGALIKLTGWDDNNDRFFYLQDGMRITRTMLAISEELQEEINAAKQRAREKLKRRARGQKKPNTAQPSLNV